VKVLLRYMKNQTKSSVPKIIKFIYEIGMFTHNFQMEMHRLL